MIFINIYLISDSDPDYMIFININLISDSDPDFNRDRVVEFGIVEDKSHIIFC